ncbi:hypothetical protein AAY473_004243 [Plecturocebus cupreus]
MGRNQCKKAENTRNQNASPPTGNRSSSSAREQGLREDECDELTESGFRRQGLTREGSGMILAHCKLHLLDSSDLPLQPPAYSSDHRWLMRTSYKILGQGLTLPPWLEYNDIIIAHCSLRLLGSNDPPASASCVDGTKGWSAVMRSWFTAISASWIQAILLSLPPDKLGLQACIIVHGFFLHFE